MKKQPLIIFFPKKQRIHDYFSEFASEFWGPAHGHIWKFRKINDVLLIEIKNYT